MFGKRLQLRSKIEDNEMWAGKNYFFLNTINLSLIFDLLIMYLTYYCAKII